MRQKIINITYNEGDNFNMLYICVLFRFFSYFTGWDCRFTRNASLIPKSVNKKSVKELVIGFFKFYSLDVTSKMILSPLTGYFIHKKKMQEMDLPPPYRTYKFNLLKQTITDKFKITTGICLQDPIQLNCNLTSSLNGDILNNFRWLCKETVNAAKSWK